jgi:DNA-binding response OmpR family regulator
MSASSKKEKILLIESNASLSEQISSVLKDAGYTVFTVKDGLKGLESLSEIEPAVAILDLAIPKLDAYELLNKKSSDKKIADIPVIGLSTQGEAISIGQVPKDSPIDFVVSLKPDPADILDRVNRQLGHTQSMTPSTDKKSILWVEDDKLIGSILGRKFANSDFNLIHANNGQEALGMLKESNPDIFILDLMLPGMDGFEILQKIRMESKFNKTPAIILSNLSKPSDFEKAKMLGVSKFLVKASSSLDQIILEVKNILDGKKK